MAGALALAVLGTCPQAATAGVEETGYELDRIGRFDDPVTAATAPGRSSRDLVFVLERAGVVRVIRDSKVRRRPFLDISDLVGSVDTEQGLLSIAFDPGYERNRRFYLYFTTPSGAIEIEQFRRERGHAALADPDSGRATLFIPHPASRNHNGGQLQFGPDGMLWITTGDGHPGCDPPENAQNTGLLLGKLLRIDPAPGGGYTNPRGNPFVGRPGADEVYAYGFRNPWRFSIDERSDTIAIGDVGQFSWEEIDIVPLADLKGANFGWDAYEGFVPLALAGPCATDSPTPLPADPVFPVLTFPHSSDDPEQYTGCAVIGGLIVRDRRLGSLRGRYLYSDHCNGRLRSLDPASGAADDSYLGPRVRFPTSIISGRRGRVYLTSRTGPIFRLDPAPEPSPAP